MSCSKAYRGPLRLDPHTEARVQPKTLAHYRQCALKFVEYLDDHGYLPMDSDDWDDFLIQYKNDCAITYSAFVSTVAAVEYFFPRFRGRMGWSHSVLKGWGSERTVRHTTPMGRGPASLIALRMCEVRRPREGMGVIVQQRLGLRPSELLQLRARDISFEVPVDGSAPFSLVRLGREARGTKVKREQFAILRSDAHEDIFETWRALVCSLNPDDFIVPCKYHAYARLISQTVRGLGLDIRWTPHSPRAGFATDAVAAGRPIASIQEEGRWRSADSFRTYVDVVSAAAIGADLAKAGWGQQQALATAHVGTVLARALGFSHHACQGLASDRRGPVLAGRSGRAPEAGIRAVSYTHLTLPTTPYV